MKQFALVTHDPVNEWFIRGRVEERGQALTVLSLRDPPPDGQFDRILIDWDSLDSPRRENLLAGVLGRGRRGKVGLSSYNLNEEDAVVLRKKGLAVFGRLDPDALSWLLGG
jgi:hypothetical protein